MRALLLTVLLQVPPPVVPPGGLQLTPGQEGPRVETIDLRRYPELVPPPRWRPQVPAPDLGLVRFRLFWVPLDTWELEGICFGPSPSREGGCDWVPLESWERPWPPPGAPQV